MLQTRPTRDDDRAVPYLRAGSLERLSEFDSFPTMYASQRETEVYGVRRGDLLVAEGGDVGRTEFARDLPDQTIIQNSLHIIRADLGDIRFIRYCLEALRASGWIDVLCNRATFGHLTVEKLRSLEIPWPTKTHQEAIADFLDAETARIDGLIAKKRRMMDSLEERYQTWLRGQLRSLQAETLPLKRRWRVIDCKHRTPTYVSEGGYPVVSPGDVEPGRLDLSRAHRFVDDVDYLDLTDGGRRPKRGDIIYSRNASIGIAAYVDTDKPFCMGQDVCLVTSDHQDQLYLSCVLNSLGVDQLEADKIGTTFSRINVAQILELRIPVPHPTVQREFAVVFDRERQRVVRLTSTIERQIDLLAERRQALITAAVTGELDVPESIAEAAS